MKRFTEDSRLFILNEPHAPRLNPALAVEIGLNESIVFLQLEFLIVTKGETRDGRRWIKRSASDLRDDFPYISKATINRTLAELLSRKLINEANYNGKKYDKTRWFAINLAEADKLKSITVKGTDATPTMVEKTGGSESGSAQIESGSAQIEPGSAQAAPTIHRDDLRDHPTENTHTAGGAVGGGDSRSRHSMRTCYRFACHLQRTRQGVTNAGGFATTIFRSGTHDELIDDYLQAEEAETQQLTTPVELISFDDAVELFGTLRELSSFDLQQSIADAPVTDETRSQLVAHFERETAAANGNGHGKNNGKGGEQGTKRRRAKSKGQHAAVIAQETGAPAMRSLFD
jgi:hypothetical protein